MSEDVKKKYIYIYLYISRAFTTVSSALKLKLMLFGLQCFCETKNHCSLETVSHNHTHTAQADENHLVSKRSKKLYLWNVLTFNDCHLTPIKFKFALFIGSISEPHKTFLRVLVTTVQTCSNQDVSTVLFTVQHHHVCDEKLSFTLNHLSSSLVLIWAHLDQECFVNYY